MDSHKLLAIGGFRILSNTGKTSELGFRCKAYCIEHILFSLYLYNGFQNLLKHHHRSVRINPNYDETMKLAYMAINVK